MTLLDEGRPGVATCIAGWRGSHRRRSDPDRWTIAFGKGWVPDCWPLHWSLRPQPGFAGGVAR